MFNLIISTDNQGLYSRQENVPWNFDEIEQRFDETTCLFEKYRDHPNIVVMGSNTWRLMKHKLANRITIVISKRGTSLQKENETPNYIMKTFEELLNHCKPKHQFENQTIFIIGGKKLISYVITRYSNLVTNVFAMIVRNTFQCRLNDSFLQLSQFQQLSLRKICGYILQNCRNNIDNRYYDVEFIQYYNLDSDTINTQQDNNLMKLISFNDESQNEFETIELYQSLNDDSNQQNEITETHFAQCCNCFCPTQTETKQEKTLHFWFCNSCIEEKCRCIFC